MWGKKARRNRIFEILIPDERFFLRSVFKFLYKFSEIERNLVHIYFHGCAVSIKIIDRRCGFT